jgi:hypothetical protein
MMVTPGKEATSAPSRCWRNEPGHGRGGGDSAVLGEVGDGLPMTITAYRLRLAVHGRRSGPRRSSCPQACSWVGGIEPHYRARHRRIRSNHRPAARSDGVTAGCAAKPVANRLCQQWDDRKATFDGCPIRSAARAPISEARPTPSGSCISR